MSFPHGWSSWHSGGHCPCAGCVYTRRSRSYLCVYTQLNKYFWGSVELFSTSYNVRGLSHDFSGSTRRNIMRWCNDQKWKRANRLWTVSPFSFSFFYDFSTHPVGYCNARPTNIHRRRRFSPGDKQINKYPKFLSNENKALKFDVRLSLFFVFG